MEETLDSDALKRFAFHYKRGIINRAEYETAILARFSLRLGECDDRHLRLFVICHNPTGDSLACNMREEENSHFLMLIGALGFHDMESGEEAPWNRMTRRTIGQEWMFDIPESWMIPPLESRSFLIEADVNEAGIDFIHPVFIGEYSRALIPGRNYQIRFQYWGSNQLCRKSNTIQWMMPMASDKEGPQDGE